jgi:hypothetical protein
LEFWILQWLGADGFKHPFGIIVLDPAADKLYVRTRPDLRLTVGKHAELAAGVATEIQHLAMQHGAQALMQQIEDRFSNNIQVSDSRQTDVTGGPSAADELLKKYVIAPDIT